MRPDRAPCAVCNEPMQHTNNDALIAVTVDAPIGPLAVALRDGMLCGLRMGVGDVGTARKLDGKHAAIVDALTHYFDGEVTAIDDIPVHATGSPFQQRVWDALRTIPVGETVSYAQLAATVGTPKASRAVGRANATNPVGIVVPCHRVVRADGTLGGYGGGIERKRWLLAHERAHSRRAGALRV